MTMDINKTKTVNNFSNQYKEQSSKQAEKRKDLLKSYLKRLAGGEDLAPVQEEFVKNFKDVEAGEIMEAEQELMEEGTPLEEVQRLCDLHSALFHGATREEKIAQAEQAIMESLKSQKEEDKDGETIQPSEQAFSDQDRGAQDLGKVKGHPLQTFKKENKAFMALVDDYEKTKNEDLLASIREISTHYAKKGDLLYPHLKVKYGISGPSDVMWTVDDEIRDELKKLAQTEDHDLAWQAQVNQVLNRAKEMVYKEENILFPICADHFSQEEWFSIYQDSKDYAPCFGIVVETWEEAENYQPDPVQEFEGEVVMPGGHMTVEELTALLDTIPLEISFVDAKNINRYFNEGPKVFKRPKMAIDREVFSCHPPKVEPLVRSIIGDFRKGTKDKVAVWMEKGGRTCLVTYMAVRDHKGKYLGTMEVVQDMEFAKEHFQEKTQTTKN